MEGDEAWSGPVDHRGRPHGRGTLSLGKRARFEGRMEHGSRSGVGTLVVYESSDDESNEVGEGREALSTLRVRWVGDMPHGAGVFTEPGGAYVHGVWEHGGELEGLTIEHHPKGALRFCGTYLSGSRNSLGVEIAQDGGALVGTWASGALHGRACAYLYPCRNGGALVGEWRHGVMLAASHHLPDLRDGFRLPPL